MTRLSPSRMRVAISSRVQTRASGAISRTQGNTITWRPFRDYDPSGAPNNRVVERVVERSGGVKSDSLCGVNCRTTVEWAITLRCIKSGEFLSEIYNGNDHIYRNRRPSRRGGRCAAAVISYSASTFYYPNGHLDINAGLLSPCESFTNYSNDHVYTDSTPDANTPKGFFVRLPFPPCMFSAWPAPAGRSSRPFRMSLTKALVSNSENEARIHLS